MKKTNSNQFGEPKKKRSRKNQLYYYSMIIPGMVFLVIFHYIPMFGIIIAFENYVPAKGFIDSKWVGLAHFKRMFLLKDCAEIFRNTIVIALGKIILGSLVAIIFAILLNEIRIKFLKKVTQTIVYLPHFLSWVILSTVVINTFKLDGTVNQIIQSMGLDKINFLGSNKNFQPLLIGTHVWKEFGYNSIVYLAAITAVDPGLHEAASIDGAGWLKRVWHITLPGMLPIILMMMAVNISGILSAGFEQVYNLYSPLVYETGDILDTYVYRVGLISRQYSFGTAVGLLKSVVGIILMVGTNEFSKKVAHRRVF